MSSKDKQFANNSRYVNTQVRKDISVMLKKLAKHRGINLQELLLELVEESVDIIELNEIGYEDYIELS